MLLVPRQLRRAGMTGDVPYYGGRLSPAQAYAVSHPAGRPPPAPPPSRQPVPARQRGGHAGRPAAPPRHGRDQRGRVPAVPGAGAAVTGPVQVLVVGFDRPAFSGEVMAEFTRLREAGVVRLVDLLLVRRAEDGAIDTLDVPDGEAAGPRPAGRHAPRRLRERRRRRGRRPDPDADPDDVPLWSLADAVPPGSAAAVALIEHVWAEPLMAAIRRAGGTPLDETWLASPDLAALERAAEEPR